MGDLVEKDSVLVLIPARYQSERFPGKPLASLSGRSMIERVFFNCSESGYRVAVVTDSSEIEDCVINFGGECFRVDDSVRSGTERIYLGWQRFFKKKRGDQNSYDRNDQLIINVQGDEPLLRGEDLKALVGFHRNSDCDIATFVKAQRGNYGWSDHNRVKVVWDQNKGQCFYFSRTSIPCYSEIGENDLWWMHVGVYSYRAKALEFFCESPIGNYEGIENLEQLRGLEAGLKISALPIERELVGVDTKGDIKEVEKYL